MSNLRGVLYAVCLLWCVLCVLRIMGCVIGRCDLCVGGLWYVLRLVCCVVCCAFCVL